MDHELLVGVLALALALSEFLALFPKVKANGIFQFIAGALKALKDLVKKK